MKMRECILFRLIEKSALSFEVSNLYIDFLLRIGIEFNVDYWHHLFLFLSKGGKTMNLSPTSTVGRPNELVCGRRAA